MIRQYYFFLLETLVDHAAETESTLDRERQRIDGFENKLEAVRTSFQASLDERTSNLHREIQVHLDEQTVMYRQLETAQLNLQSRQIEQSALIRGRIDGVKNEFNALFSKQREAINDELRVLQEKMLSLSESSTLSVVRQSAALGEIREFGIAQSAGLAAKVDSYQNALAKLTAQTELTAQTAQAAETYQAAQTDQIADAMARFEQQFGEQLRAETSRCQMSADRLHSEFATELKTLATEREHLSARLADLGRFTYQTRTELTLQGRRISILLEELRRSPQQLSADEASIASAKSDDHKYDALYLAFEDIFRGTRQEIKDRQSVYLPLLTATNIGTRKMPILDLGSGRGEWLELLRDQGLNASGVDHNQAMVEQCDALGLRVTRDNALRHLRSLPDASLGAVTSFHMVEHIPFGLVLELVDEALRVLKPGGLLILETPNPQNLQVGAFTFYYDPTHLRPLPPGMLRFFVEARGFSDVRITELHPYAEVLHLPEDGPGLAQRFNEHFYGPQDYAVIGKRA